MKCLTVEQVPDRRNTIWVSEAAIMTKHADAKSVVLAVDGMLYNSDSYYLREKPSDEHDYYPRCAGVIEATDEEMEILKSAGYWITDLRRVCVSELVKKLVAW